jgi:hypothetical protein
MLALYRAVGLTQLRRVITAASIAAVATAGLAGGTGTTALAANTPGTLEFKLTAPLPLFPCGDCLTSVSGTSVGAIKVGSKTLSTGAVRGFAVYHEIGCPTSRGFASGDLDVALSGGNTAHLQFTYQRVGVVAVISTTGFVTGHISAPLAAGTAVADFSINPATRAVPPCRPGPATLTAVGLLALG